MNRMTVLMWAQQMLFHIGSLYQEFTERTFEIRN